MVKLTSLNQPPGVENFVGKGITPDEIKEVLREYGIDHKSVLTDGLILHSQNGEVKKIIDQVQKRRNKEMANLTSDAISLSDMVPGM
jgi:hypothetical protein